MLESEYSSIFQLHEENEIMNKRKIDCKIKISMLQYKEEITYKHNK